VKTILITGATRGLGLALAKRLAAEPNVHLVLGVRDREAGRRVARDLGPQAEAVQLDMSSLASIKSLTSNWDRPLFALINNAGLQNVGPTRFSEGGIEITLAVNHIGPLLLTLGLLPWLAEGTVLGIGSGTHNPEDKGATRFGFRGGRFTSIAELARGEVDAESDQQAGYDRYATSKLLSMTTGVELARRNTDTRFLCLDPGLMPGTGLARTAPRAVRLLWHNLLPLLVPLMSGASTPTRSAAAGARLVLNAGTAKSGGIYDQRARESDRVWDKVSDAEFGATVVDQSIEWLADIGAAPARTHAAGSD